MKTTIEIPNELMTTLEALEPLTGQPWEEILGSEINHLWQRLEHQYEDALATTSEAGRQRVARADQSRRLDHTRTPADVKNAVNDMKAVSAWCKANKNGGTVMIGQEQVSLDARTVQDRLRDAQSVIAQAPARIAFLRRQSQITAAIRKDSQTSSKA
jgi:phage host-nuclease inhibitor protein Gam